MKKILKCLTKFKFKYQEQNFEFDKYESLAKNILKDPLNVKQHELKIPLFLREPYEMYEKIILQEQKSKGSLLEIGSGIGNYTSILLKTNMNVVASDISPNSLKVLSKRFKNMKFKTKLANMEKLPFKDASFDLVCGVGFLSYGDNVKTINEIYRVLKTGCYFICVDSLNNNFIYRLNRYFQFIKGNTSLHTIRKMPNLNLIKNYEFKFNRVKTYYFGSLIWLAPIISLICSQKVVTKLIRYVDKKIKVKSSAFRFLLIAKK